MTTEEVQRANRRRWVEALRSGAYQQGGQFLRKRDKFCCLGVACDLFAEELDLEVEESGGEYKYDEETKFLPQKVREYIGVTATGITKKQYQANPIERSDSLVVMNDYGMTFEEISDVIEEEWGI